MGSRQITEHFNEDEFRCPCGCGRMEFSDQGIRVLEKLRVRVGRAVTINSGYRCPKYNAEVSGTGLTGPHTIIANRNVTADIKTSGAAAFELLHAAMGLGFTGFGIKQNGPHSSRFIHLDMIPPGVRQLRPRIWSY